jgi:peroxisomal 3,2-trans-enoyl-CoA isomerase
MVDFVNRAKWNAWSELGNLSQADAEKQYIDIVNELARKEAPAQEETKSETSKFECILTSVEHGNIYKITLNRPAKLNALTVQMVVY